MAASDAKLPYRAYRPRNFFCNGVNCTFRPASACRCCSAGSGEHCPARSAAMRYVRLYTIAIYRSWVALLSGIGSIILTVLGPAFPDAMRLFYAAALACLAAAIFTVWLNELLEKEKAEKSLSDAKIKRETLLQIASLIDQGRQFQRASILHSGNYGVYLNMIDGWRKEVRVFAVGQGVQVKLLAMDDMLNNDSATKNREIDGDIEVLQSIQNAL